jgi:hypothetical protein
MQRRWGRLPCFQASGAVPPRGTRERLCYPERMSEPAERTPAEPDAPSEKPPRRPAGPLAVARAVFWSFFGVRKRSDLEADAESLTPAQVIAGGVLGAVVLIACLMAVVMLVTR